MSNTQTKKLGSRGTVEVEEVIEVLSVVDFGPLGNVLEANLPVEHPAVSKRKVQLVKEEAELKTLQGIPGADLSSAIKSAEGKIAALKAEISALGEVGKPVLRQVALANLIGKAPDGYFGDNICSLHFTKDLDGLWSINSSVKVKTPVNGRGQHREKSTFHDTYGTSAKSVCDRLGFYVNGSSAVEVIKREAAKAGVEVSAVVARAGSIG